MEECRGRKRGAIREVQGGKGKEVRVEGGKTRRNGGTQGREEGKIGR